MILVCAGRVCGERPVILDKIRQVHLAQVRLPKRIAFHDLPPVGRGQQCVVLTQIDRLGADALQAGMAAQIERYRRLLRRRQLAQAQFDALQMAGPWRQSRLNSLLDQVSRVIQVQLENGQELASAAAVGPARPELRQKSFVDCGPLRPPPPQRDGGFESAGPLRQQLEVVPRVQDVRLPAQAAQMGRPDHSEGQDFNSKNVGPQHPRSTQVLGGHGVAVGLENHLTVRIRLHGVRGPGLVGARGRR